jgi:hypothetical protein
VHVAVPEPVPAHLRVQNKYLSCDSKQHLMAQSWQARGSGDSRCAVNVNSQSYHSYGNSTATLPGERPGTEPINKPH